MEPAQPGRHLTLHLLKRPKLRDVFGYEGGNPLQVSHIFVISARHMRDAATPRGIANRPAGFVQPEPDDE